LFTRLPKYSKLQIGFAAAWLAVLVAEAWVVLIARESAFTIQGLRRYGIAEFNDGKPVMQAFYMRGDGLQSVAAQIIADRPAIAHVKWTLWRGFLDEPPMIVAAQGAQDVNVGRGRGWTRFAVTRDGSSDNRWYTFELQLLDKSAEGGGDGPPPRIELAASRDNPDRGGALWVDGIRQPGSLVMRAERRGQTVRDRFQTRAAPHLPGWLQNELTQWLIVAMLHWAAVVASYGLIFDERRVSKADH
jgi:hypothetical protein